MGYAEEFRRTGMAVVEDALDPAFCESVIDARLRDIGVDEADAATWPVGPRHLPATTVHPIEEVAPRAAEALYELVGGADRLTFKDLPDNLIINFPNPEATWWPPSAWDAAGAGWHKDGDWFRHFLDSPEQGILGIVFWRDVTAEQGATYVAVDSIGPVARHLVEHPEGVEGAFPYRDILAGCRDFRALTGRQGTVVWAHPFMVHTASVNATSRLRIISNTTAILREPSCFAGPDERVPIEQVVLDALGVASLDFEITGERRRLVPERERRWAEERARYSPG